MLRSTCICKLGFGIGSYRLPTESFCDEVKCQQIISCSQDIPMFNSITKKKKKKKKTPRR
ncbi:hypothetical protein Hanom_Chr05g00403081 [Helianthus anomalus]